MRLPVPMVLVLAALLLAAPARAQMNLGLRPSLGTDATETGSVVTLPEDSTVASSEDDSLPVRPLVRKAKEDPYAPLGIRAGSFILYPALTVGGGYTTNSTSSAGGGGAAFLSVTPELRIESDWARHAATLTLRGNYEQFFDGSTGNPSASADWTGRLDLPSEWTADLAAGYSFQRQAISDSDYPAGADSPPGVHDLTASVALNGHVGRAAFTAAANVERSLYEDARSGITVIDQGDRNNTLIGGRLRLAYDGGGILSPFVEGTVARRLFDQTVDDDGIRRSATGLGARAGVKIDDDPVLTGEFGVGVAQVKLDDPAFDAFAALTLDGTITWSPTRLTTVTLDTSTALNPSTNVASPGSVVTDASLEAAYAMRENLTLALNGSLEHEAVRGTGETDITYQAGASATWKLNRMAQLTATYTHEWLDSTTSSADYQSDTIKLELRTQR